MYPICFIGLSVLCANDFVSYYSPSIQIGYSSNQGYFISGQISFGIGYKDIPILPGATFGIRRYRNMTMIYTDAQLVVLFMGLGKGLSNPELVIVGQ